MAYVFEECHKWDLAEDQYRALCKLRSEEPQSYFDHLVATFNKDISQFNNCVRIGDIVLSKQWDRRFSQIELSVLMVVLLLYRMPNSQELHRMARIESARQGITIDFGGQITPDGVGDSQHAPLPLDLLVRLQWAHDPCDISLCIRY